jgi:hypothetical protein
LVDATAVVRLSDGFVGAGFYRPLMHVLAIFGGVITGLLFCFGIVYGAIGVLHVVSLLHVTPPSAPKTPATRWAQILSTHWSRMKGWAGIFSAALVGAAIADYDRDGSRGFGRMLGLFLFVGAFFIIAAGVSMGLAGRRAATDAGHNLPRYDPGALLWSCVLAGVLLGTGVAALGVLLM